VAAQECEVGTATNQNGNWYCSAVDFTTSFSIYAVPNMRDVVSKMTRMTQSRISYILVNIFVAVGTSLELGITTEGCSDPEPEWNDNSTTDNNSGSLHQHDAAGFEAESKSTKRQSNITVEGVAFYDHDLHKDVEQGQNQGSLSQFKGAQPDWDNCQPTVKLSGSAR